LGVRYHLNPINFQKMLTEPTGPHYRNLKTANSNPDFEFHQNLWVP
jgi:hypothetical protein